MNPLMQWLDLDADDPMPTPDETWADAVLGWVVLVLFCLSAGYAVAGALL